jgi:hypothetical protein
MARKDSARRFCSAKCASVARSGSKHHAYNGGLSQDPSGRWKIMCRDGTQMWFYRGVAAAQLGRLLDPDEVVHHADEDPSNDDLSNLVVTTRSAHIAMHREALNGNR